MLAEGADDVADQDAARDSRQVARDYLPATPVSPPRGSEGAARARGYGRGWACGRRWTVRSGRGGGLGLERRGQAMSDASWRRTDAWCGWSFGSLAGSAPSS